MYWDVQSLPSCSTFVPLKEGDPKIHQLVLPKFYSTRKREIDKNHTTYLIWFNSSRFKNVLAAGSLYTKALMILDQINLYL